MTMGSIALLSGLGYLGDPGLPGFHRGSTGSGVMLVQQRLLAAGYSIGSSGVDGDFGPATEAAVKDFQRGQNLYLKDGIVGPLTWAALGAYAGAESEYTTGTPSEQRYGGPAVKVTPSGILTTTPQPGPWQETNWPMIAAAAGGGLLILGVLWKVLRKKDKRSQTKRRRRR